MNKKLIVILCEPRTGSNLLCEAVESYSSLQCISEFYLSPYSGLYVKKDNVPDDLPHKDMLSLEQQDSLFTFLNIQDRNHYEMLVNIYNNPIDALLELYKITDKTLVVKIMRLQFNELDLDRLIDFPFVEIIVLERSNKLEEYVSHMKAIEHNKWFNVDTSNIKIKVDVDKFLKRLNESNDWYLKIRQHLIIANKNYLELNYETHLLEFDQEEFCKMFDIWLEKINITTDKTNHKMHFFKKQNNAPIENSISNYDEVMRLYNGS